MLRNVLFVTLSAIICLASITTLQAECYWELERTCKDFGMGKSKPCSSILCSKYYGVHNCPLGSEGTKASPGTKIPYTEPTNECDVFGRTKYKLTQKVYKCVSAVKCITESDGDDCIKANDGKYYCRSTTIRGFQTSSMYGRVGSGGYCEDDNDGCSGDDGYEHYNDY